MHSGLFGSLKEERGAKKSTVQFYRNARKRVYPAIGHIRMVDLRAEHLNNLYSSLLKDGENKRGGKLSVRTVLGYHRFISMVLEQGVKEGIVPFAVSTRVELPKAEKKTPNYFQPSEITAIQDALETEHIRWRALIHLMMITGARRGEILGLKWNAVNLERKQLHICNNILYRPGIGVYEDTPKTERSERFVSIPDETVTMLKEYRRWQSEHRLRLGAYYQDRGYLFAQDNGDPLHPDSVTSWCAKFSKRHGLPHINPHAFRHTAVSMLYFGGMDSVSIANRVGHAQVSTTQDIYGHVMEEADRRSADVLANIMLKRAQNG